MQTEVPRMSDMVQTDDQDWNTKYMALQNLTVLQSASLSQSFWVMNSWSSTYLYRYMSSRHHAFKIPRSPISHD